MIPASITHISQNIDLRTGVASNIVYLSLPGSATVALTATDEVVKQLFEALALHPPTPQPSSPSPFLPSIPSAFQPTVSEKGEMQLEFGGDVVEPPPPEQPRRARPIQKDDMGYPILESGPSIDASQVMEPDDDYDGDSI